MVKLRAFVVAAVLISPLIGALLAAPSSAAGPPLGMVQGPTRLDEGTANLTEHPQVAVNAEGTAVAVWVQATGTYPQVWASRFAPSSGWSAPAPLSSVSANPLSAVQVVAASDGSFLATWINASSSSTLWYSRLDAMSGWSAPLQIATSPGQDVAAYSLSADGLGHVFAAVQEGTGDIFNVSAQRYSPGAGWDGPQLLDTLNESAYRPLVAADEGGNATAVWYQGGLSGSWVFASRFTPAGGWAAPENIGQNQSVYDVAPSVGMGSTGVALVAWMRYDIGGYQIYSARYDPGAGWSAPVAVENPTPSTSWLPALTVDAAGDAVVVWIRENNSASSVFAAAYTQGAWGSPTRLSEAGTAIFLFDSTAAGNAAGDAFGVWRQVDNGTWSIVGSRYVKGVGWSAPLRLGGDAVESAVLPTVALNRDGDAAVVWITTRPAVLGAWVWEVTPPPLVVLSPTNGQSSSVASAWVNGTTEPGATVLANGVKAAVGATGDFSVLIPLARGNNTITTTAADTRGNEATDVRYVTFIDPTSVLRAALSLAQANLSAAEARIASLETALLAAEEEIANARTNLSAAQLQLTALETDVNSTQGELDAAHANLSLAQTSVAALEAQADATAAELVAAQARLAVLEEGATATEAELAATRADLTAAQEELTSAREDVDQSRSDAQAASDAAVSASNLATLAMILAVVGLAVGVGATAAVMLLRRRPAQRT